MNELENLNEEKTIWEKPEEFMLKIVKIHNAKTKLSFWNFKYEYKETYDSILNPVNVLKSVKFI